MGLVWLVLRASAGLLAPANRPWKYGIAVVKKFQGRRVPSPRMKQLILTRW